ncbi:MAG: TIGR03905 family TSCPD domain-containing protein [Clostridia bacterium]|nr:TIGR03905 family TSCPD domain-containing protein [Clostridia bacterium]MBQ7865307.1 TIGR03905 family TSCPD domain-containing protein [Clostridia bacterium]
MFTYKCNGTCSTQIELEIQDGIITFCKFTRGCKGNTEGLARTVIGQNAEEIASRLEGIECRGNTSCPDQLAKAIRAYKA